MPALGEAGGRNAGERWGVKMKAARLNWRSCNVPNNARRADQAVCRRELT